MIIPYDGTRVRLQANTELGDYVNASWIFNSPDMKIIAAQSPLPRTVPHFLQMIQENNVSLVVTLTKDNEEQGEGWCYSTGSSKKNPAKFSDTCSFRAHGLCNGSPKLVGSREARNSNMQDFFCTTL